MTETVVTIRPLNVQAQDITIRGTAPYVQHKFGQKAKLAMAEDMTGVKPKARSKASRPPRDFQDDYHEAMYLDENGRRGIPAAAFRNALISACRVAGFQMTKAKLSIFIGADGMDADDATPLVHIEGEPELFQTYGRMANGATNIVIRPMWRHWTATLHLRWDGDQFSLADVVNLLVRAGQQVGIGEGRPDSRNSAGLGWGLFEVIE